MNQSRILATGKSGQIGRNLDQTVEALNGNLLSRDWETVNSFNNVRAVIHLAGIVGNANVIKNPELSRRVNVEATQELAKFVCKNTSARFIYVSSSHVYKPTNSLHSENSQISPINEYGHQKALAEESLYKIFMNNPSRLKIFRVFSVLNLNMPEGTLGWAIERYRNQKIKFSNDERDFLTAAQIAGLIQKLTLAEFDQQVVNVCTGIATSVRSAASLLLGKGSELDPHFESGKSSVPRIIGDASNLRKILNLSAEELKWRYLM